MPALGAERGPLPDWRARRPPGLANLLGERFVAGNVLYTGRQTLSFGDKIRALPLDAPWRFAP